MLIERKSFISAGYFVFGSVITNTYFYIVESRKKEGLKGVRNVIVKLLILLEP